VAAAPERSLDSMELGPTPGALAIEFRGLGEDVQSAEEFDAISEYNEMIREARASAAPPMWEMV
jgi:hypothetical protein